jgi:hypothetical protein
VGEGEGKRTSRVRVDTKLQTGGGRGIGYMLFNAHLCNQPCYCQVVVEPGAHLCTLLEVWVLGVGMSKHKRLCTTRIGDSQVPMTLDHDKTNVSLGRMAY